jgi:hypothetical protein
MPVVSGDGYVIKVQSVLLAIDCLNVFYYQQAGGTGDKAEDLFDEFDVTVLGDLVGCVVNDFDIQAVEVFSINNPDDFHSGSPVNNTGLRTFTGNERQAAWACFGYKSNRAGAGSRSSYKRFCGLLENDSNGGGLSSAFLALTPVDDLQNSMADALLLPAGTAMVPVQVKSGWLVGSAPTINFDISSWQTPIYTTQVSRKT